MKRLLLIVLAISAMSNAILAMEHPTKEHAILSIAEDLCYFAKKLSDCEQGTSTLEVKANFSIEFIKTLLIKALEEALTQSKFKSYFWSQSVMSKESRTEEDLESKTDEVSLSGIVNIIYSENKNYDTESMLTLQVLSPKNDIIARKILQDALEDVSTSISTALSSEKDY
jgi:hypothetical protein